MTKASLVQAMLANREGIYRFLGRLYLLEAGDKLLCQICRLQFPTQSEAPELVQGYAMLRQYALMATPDSAEELAVDYARVFLAAGVAQGLAAFPYESVYTGRQRLMMGEPGSSVAEEFASRGLCPDEKAFHTPEDHIGLELEFMALLCAQGIEAAQAKDGPKLLECAKEQRRFLEGHLFNWYAGFCRDVEKYAATDFYKAVAKITSGFMELEGELMSMGDEIWAIA